MSALARSQRAFPSRFLAGILAVRTRLASSGSLLAAEAAEAQERREAEAAAKAAAEAEALAAQVRIGVGYAVWGGGMG